MNIKTWAYLFNLGILSTISLVYPSSLLAQTCIQEKEPNFTIPEAMTIPVNQCVEGELFYNKKNNDQDAFHIKPSSQTRLIRVEYTPPAKSPVSIQDLISVKKNKKGQVTDYKKFWNHKTPRTTTILMPANTDNWYATVAGFGDKDDKYRLIIHSEAIPESNVSDKDTLSGTFRRTGRLNKEGRFQLYWTPEKTSQYTLEFHFPPKIIRYISLRDSNGKEMISMRNWQKTGYLSAHQFTAQQGKKYLLYFESHGGRVSDFIASIKESEKTDTPKYAEPEPNHNKKYALPATEIKEQSIAGKGILLNSEQNNDKDVWILDIPESAKDYHSQIHVSFNGIKAQVILRDEQWKQLQVMERKDYLTLSNLALKPGRYYLEITSWPPIPVAYHFQWTRQAKLSPAMEQEPNDNNHTAQVIDASQVIRGNFYNHNLDVYRFRVSGEPQLWRFIAVGTGIKSMALRHFKNNHEISYRKSHGQRRIKLDQILLWPGEYILELQGSEGKYIVRPIAMGIAPAEMLSEIVRQKALKEKQKLEQKYSQVRPLLDRLIEHEPNNSFSNAQTIYAGQIISGTTSTGTDCYRFSLDKTQNIRLSLTNEGTGGVGAMELKWGNQEIYYASLMGGAGENLHDLRLDPGYYSLCLYKRGAGDDAYYKLKYEQVSVHPIERASEPDIKHHWSPTWRPGQVITGRIYHKEDDRYIIKAGNKERKLKLCLLDNSNKKNKPHYVVEFAAAKTVKRAEAWLDSSEQAPGRYRWQKLTSINKKDKDAPICTEITQLAKTDVYVKFYPHYTYRGKPDYQAILLNPDDPMIPLPYTPDQMNSELSLTFKTPEKLAAFTPWQQKITAHINIRNNSKKSQTFMVSVTSNNDKVETHLIKVSDAQQTLAADQSVSIPVELTAEPELVDYRQLILEVALYQSERKIQQARADITPVPEALPANPSYWAQYSDQLLGGMIVSQASLGAKLINPNKKRDYYANGLNDELVTNWGSHHAQYPVFWKSLPYIDLPGDNAVELTGVVITPAWHDLPTWSLKDFKVEISLDGKQWTEALNGTLKLIGDAQGFEFPQPVKASFIRLRPLNHHYKDVSTYRIREFKAITRPEQHPDNIERIDLSLNRLGGHVVYAKPDFAQMYSLKTRDWINQRYAKEPYIVLGFHHNRVALIDEITIQQVTQKNLDGKSGLSKVVIESSISSPAGPWEVIWEGELEQTSDTIQSIRPRDSDNKARWARFLRFRYLSGEKGFLPPNIQVFEMPAGSELPKWQTISAKNKKYRSILGAWGDNTISGPLEWAYANPPVAKPESDPENNQQKGADKLSTDNQVIENWVNRGEDIDWYIIHSPEDNNRLAVTLAGTPSLTADIKAYNKEGKELDVLERVDKPGSTELIIDTEEAKTLWLKVEDPMASLVFTWDTSASTASFHQSIYQAISSTALQLRPGLEQINLLPFGANNLLLPEFSSDRLEILLALSQARGQYDSSNSPPALFHASEGLKNHRGGRYILHITDAATSRGKLLKTWQSFQEGWPVISNYALTSQGAFGPNPVWELDYMQDWSTANNGYYHYIGDTKTILEDGLRRAMTKLQQPSFYKLSARAYSVDLGPGTLLIEEGNHKIDSVTASKPSPKTRNVYFILDASGSMLKRMKGKRRFDIATQAILTAANDPAIKNDDISLRVFGLGGKGSCQTEVLLPPAKKNRKKLKRILKIISPVNGAKTAIAESLKQAAGDLSSRHKDNLLLLVTDGEETCDGDPGTVIEAIRKKGINLRVSIVGFALDDQAIKDQFREWAEAGGGEFFDAADSQALVSALKKATIRPKPKNRYKIYTKDGDFVAMTLAGTPLELDSGEYQIKRKGNNEVIATVTIKSQQQTVHRIKSSKP